MAGHVDEASFAASRKTARVRLATSMLSTFLLVICSDFQKATEMVSPRALPYKNQVTK